ncbi:MAG: hypothetical protein GVY34_10920 [Alphaproteobacteria bacterium]|nr:hypothetical protein [Alphaproteobacteria bacterium]
MFCLYRGERIGIAILCFLGLALVALLGLGGTPIHWPAFTGGLAFYGMLAMAGLGLRVLGRFPRVSQVLFAVGILPIFATFLALVGYMFFPLQRPLVDELLFAVDASLGYDWGEMVAWLAAHPDLSAVLRIVYGSSFFQLAVLLVWLGLAGRSVALQRMVVTLMLSGVVATAFWAIWPSFGPSAYIDIPAETLAASQLLVTPEYGAFLMNMAEQGIDEIGGHVILGAIAFPSFHIVMAVIAVWFARGTWLAWPYAATNLLMIPATLGHGGHHLIDLAGGAAVFALCHWLSTRWVTDGTDPHPLPRANPGPLPA